MRNPNSVLRAGVWVAIVLVVVLIIRFFDLMIVRAEELQKKVAEQRVKGEVLHPERGKILDRNGSVMAMSLVTYNVSIHPNLLDTEERKDEVAGWLSEALEEPKEEMRKIVDTKDPKNPSKPAQWASVKKKVPFAQAQILKAHKDTVFKIEEIPFRYYPNGELGANYLGFVNQGNVPGAGLELSLNSYISGKSGYTVAERGKSGKVVPVGYENIISPLDGYNVTLTIDSYMQYVLEKHLKQGMEKFEAVAAHAVLMDPKDGAVLAMASFPSYNGNAYGDYDPKTWNNNVASYTYEPGSIMKPLFMGMALNYGTINKNSGWADNGAISIGGAVIHDWNRIGWGYVDLGKIIEYSSNVGMVEISKTMTGDQIYDGLKRIGFGEKTGIEMPIEEVGIMNKREAFQKPLYKATASFGQSISTTPIMMAKGYAQIANGGYKVTPHLVKQVDDKYGNTVQEFKEEKKEEIYKPQVSELLKQYLKQHAEGDSGTSSRIEGYDIATKTGTAQKAAETGGYKDGAIIGSIAGFAPLEQPEFVLVVTVDEPNVQYGSQSAGPIFKDIMAELLTYKHIPKKGETKQSATVNVPDVKWMTVGQARKVLEEANVAVEVKGKGEVVVSKRYSYKDGILHAELETQSIKEKNKWVIPNLVGMSQKEVEEIKWPFQIRVRGEGNVVEQSMQPGEKVELENETLYLWLQ